MSKLAEHAEWKNVVRKFATWAVAPEMSSIRNWCRCTPPTVSKLPMATSRLPSGEMSIFSGCVTPPLWMPAICWAM